MEAENDLTLEISEVLQWTETASIQDLVAVASACAIKYQKRITELEQLIQNSLLKSVFKSNIKNEE